MDPKNRLGCLSSTGALVAAAVLLGVLGWALVAGPVAFSPGSLSAKTKVASYGGVSSHAQLGARCEACHTPLWSGQSMTDACLGCHAEIAAEMKSGSGVHGRMLGALSTPTCKGCHTEHHGSSGPLTVRDPGTFPHDLTPFSLRGHLRSSRFARMTCEDCHPKDLTTFDAVACADCHGRLDAGFTTRHVAAFGKKCLLCHNGRDREGSGFDHNSLPFKLTGKHVGLACEKCHAAGSLQSASSTPRECIACHAKDDKHKGSFGQRCDQCHTTAGWPGAKFDHTIFPIDHGRRGQPSPCTTCHPTGVKTYTCYGCHEHTIANVLAQHRGKTTAQLDDCMACHKGGGRGD